MDRLKLVVKESTLHEHRHPGVLVRVLLPVSEQFLKGINWRRDERRRLRLVPRGSDPVLTRPKFAGALVAAANALHQGGMDLLHDTEADRNIR